MRSNTEEATCRAKPQEALAIEVTNYCNGSCLHCFARSGIRRPSSLSLDLVKEIIADGYATGYRHLHITGGEPLVWKGLFEALDYSFNVGYETVFMNTNGTLLTDSVAGRLGTYRDLSISVSLEGTETLHDRLRGSGSHYRTFRGIGGALDAGIDVTIFTTVTKSLLPELPHFINGLYEKFPAIDYLILIQLIRVTNDAFSLSEELLDPKDFIRLVQTVALLNLYGLKSIVKKNPLATVVSKLMKMPWIPGVPPLYREGSMIIMADGKIGVVHSSKNSFGRYRRGMIQRVLTSNAYRIAVAPDETTCPSCKYLSVCRENGMIRPPVGYSDTLSETPYCRKVLNRITQECPSSPLPARYSGSGPCA